MNLNDVVSSLKALVVAQAALLTNLLSEHKSDSPDPLKIESLAGQAHSNQVQTASLVGQLEEHLDAQKDQYQDLSKAEPVTGNDTAPATETASTEDSTGTTNTETASEGTSTDAAPVSTDPSTSDSSDDSGDDSGDEGSASTESASGTAQETDSTDAQPAADAQDSSDTGSTDTGSTNQPAQGSTEGETATA